MALTLGPWQPLTEKDRTDSKAQGIDLSDPLRLTEEDPQALIFEFNRTKYLALNRQGTYVRVIYYDKFGKHWLAKWLIDGSGGAAVASFVNEPSRTQIKNAIVEQLDNVPYFAGSYGSTPAYDRLAEELVNTTALTGSDECEMSQLLIVNSGKLTWNMKHLD